MQRHREIVVNLVSLEPIKEPCALSLKPLKDLGCLLVIAGAERMKEMRTCLTPRGSSTWRRQQKVRSLKASARSAHSWTTLFPLRLVTRGSVLSPAARGTEPQTHHGPLSRLLESGIVDREPPRPSTYLRAAASDDHAPTFLTRSSSVKVTLTRVSSLPPALASAAKR